MVGDFTEMGVSDPDRIPYNDFEDYLLGEIIEKYRSWDFVISILREKDVLRKLYDTYRPTNNGWWHGAPLKWTSIFNWLSCPLSSIRAIVLLMEPKLPYPAEPPGRPSAFYTSTGYALGVKGENLTVNGRSVPDSDAVDITNIPTVWNFIDILCFLFDFDDIHREQLKERFHDGFHPEWLSQEGVLFLNVYWTRCRTGRKADHELWWSVTEKVLKKINELDDNIIVFQLYNNEKLSTFLDEEFQHRVIRPEFMKARGDSNEGRRNHLGRFEQYHNKIYAETIKQKIFHFLLHDIKSGGNNSCFRNLKKVLSLFYTLVT